MFGYIRIDRANLLGKEYDAYRGVYCSLCRQLGRDYSIFARFILSYDCTFYALLALDLCEETPCYKMGRCRFNPFKKCPYANSQSKAFSLAAALSVILAYYKLRDNLLDSPWYKRWVYRLLQPFFARWRRKAAENYPQIDEIARTMLERQIKAEKDPACVLDQAADPTATMLAEMCGMLADEISLRKPLERERTRRILRSMGYFMGRWIYLVDAADDYRGDKKHHGFNPFLLSGMPEEEALAPYLQATLNHALSEALLSYGLLEKGRFDRIILNVLQSSCVSIQKNIISQLNPDEEQDGEVNEKSL